MSSVADAFLGISQKYLEQIFYKKPSDVPYLIKEHLLMSASDETTLKKNFGGSKPS